MKKVQVLPIFSYIKFRRSHVGWLGWLIFESFWGSRKVLVRGEQSYNSECTWDSQDLKYLNRGSTHTEILQFRVHPK
jgi:hypothetical protein